MIDHTKEKLTESVGVNFEEELLPKLKGLVRDMLEKKYKKPSEVMEQVLDTFSYNELLCSTTMYIMDKYEQVIERESLSAKDKLLEMLQRLSQDGKQEEEKNED